MSPQRANPPGRAVFSTQTTPQGAALLHERTAVLTCSASVKQQLVSHVEAAVKTSEVLMSTQVLPVGGTQR